MVPEVFLSSSGFVVPVVPKVSGRKSPPLQRYATEILCDKQGFQEFTLLDATPPIEVLGGDQQRG
jgi:hypothetical protein